MKKRHGMLGGSKLFAQSLEQLGTREDALKSIAQAKLDAGDIEDALKNRTYC